MTMCSRCWGAVDNRVFSKLFQAVLASDTKACIREIEEMIIQGRDLSQLVNDFVWYMRNLLIAKTTDEPGDMLDMSEGKSGSFKGRGGRR